MFELILWDDKKNLDKYLPGVTYSSINILHDNNTNTHVHMTLKIVLFKYSISKIYFSV